MKLVTDICTDAELYASAVYQEALLGPYPPSVGIASGPHVVVRYTSSTGLLGMSGFVVLREVAAEIEILYIYVRQEMRGTSTASMMLHSVFSEAKKSGVQNVFLEVSVRNFRAITFYKRNGFEQVGLRKNYYANGDDAMLMERRL